MLNGKFRCVKNSGTIWEAMTKGNIYEFKNGITKLDSGKETFRYTDLKHFHKDNPDYKLEPLELPQPHKSLLKSGDKVVYRCGTIRYVLLEINELVSKRSDGYNNLDAYDEDLKTSVYGNDIMEIWRGDELIAKRIEKSAKEIEIERIENEMRKLADDLRKVKGE